ncbi:RrF2 family transcriptional regulator [Planctomyces sp. SH-PL14]|uniref:RrF2 family transcriptional regulator n=1 Tax=Planctomyces sp. SH-PL14 TaxID=1632864 RepID=UPI00078EB90E|nr:Rrf2 family transcriptional regulator [Planctomyces sp. SH-PL14]AMV22078.1 HTH-type transcriptional regulator CymR [Planctomyces sp. SH-PL14]
MKLSRRADYALRVLVALTERYGQGPTSMSLLARENDVPRKFLEQIMADMRHQGWVESTPGRHGGFVLAQAPEKLTMGQVVRHFDGAVEPVGCLSVTNHQPCSQARLCRFRRILLEIRNFINQHLDNATLADIVTREPVQDTEVFSLELCAGDGI